MEKIKVNRYVIAKLDKLIIILIKKEYFAFEENAIKYVRSIFSFIYQIPSKSKYQCKKDKYGKYYSKLKMNHHTSYYITFDCENENYLQKYIH